MHRQNRMKIGGLFLAMTMTSSLLVGCGGIREDATLVKVDDTVITAGEGNFFMRYQQAIYENQYASMLGGVEKMWSSQLDKNKTYEDTVKNTAMDTLVNMALLENHMKEEKVELTDKEKADIVKAAKKFEKENSKEAIDLTSGTKDVVERVLTLMTEQIKMTKAIESKVDTSVSDEEAKQGKMAYVSFDYLVPGKDGSTKPMNKEEKEKMKTKAQEFANKAKAVTSLEEFQKLAEQDGLHVSSAAFDKGASNPSREVIKEVLEAGVGHVTKAVEIQDGLCVAFYETDFDKEATEAKKQSVVEQRKQKLYDDTLKKWKKKAQIEKNKSQLKKIRFEKNQITFPAPKAQPEKK